MKSQPVEFSVETDPPDETDLRILTILQEDARASNAEIGRRVGMSTSTVFERIRKLEARGVIRSYETRIDPRAVGVDVTAFVFIEAVEIGREDEVEAALLAMPEIQEIHKIAGEDAFIVKIKTKDNETLGRVLREGVERAGVRSIKTTIVLATARERQMIPLPGAD